MRYPTALMLWWAVGWGGFIDCKMLSVMRGCSSRGARDVLAAAARRGWLRCHYVNKRCAIYQVTQAGRIMAACQLNLPFLTKIGDFKPRRVDGHFAPPEGWLHAREAATTLAKLCRLVLPEYPIEPHWVFPMCQLRHAAHQKTADAILVGANFLYAFEYERSRKTGRETSKHSNWATLERSIKEVSQGAAVFGSGHITDVIVAPAGRVAEALERHLEKYSRAVAKDLHEVIKWGWFYNGALVWRKVKPRELCD